MFDVGRFGVELILHGAHDLLEDVLESNASGDGSVFVHHEGHVPVIRLELAQQVADGHRFGNALAVAGQRLQIDVVRAQTDEILDVHDAANVVERTFAHGVARVLGLSDHIEVFGDTSPQVEVDDIGSRHHHQSADHVVELEDGVQQVVLRARQFAVQVGVVQHGSDLLLRVDRVVFGGLLRAGLAQQERGGDIQAHEQGVRHEVEELQRQRTPEGHRIRTPYCVDLGKLLADDQVEAGDGGEGHRESHAVERDRRRDAHGLEQRIEQVGDRRFTDPSEAQRCHRDAQLAG